MQNWLIDFVFLRPALLWLFIPWAVLTLLQFVKQQQSKRGSLIAPHLSHIVLGNTHTKVIKQRPVLLSTFLALAIIAAAGPSIEKQEVPVYSAKQARVLVVDMSYSMYSTDIAPNRLSQARFKLMDMVELFSEGDTALVAYAGDAFTVSPLTSDAATLKNLIPSLSPQIMPSKGANLLAGIEQAKMLLEQGHYADGDIILVTDDVEQEEIGEVKSMLASTKFRLSVYAIGTREGAPISLPEGGFLKDRFGQIVVPKLNVALLKNLVSSGGLFATYSPSDEDIKTFAPRINHAEVNKAKSENVMWRVDAGIYLLVLLVPIGLVLFRQGIFQFALLMFVFLPLDKSYAMELPSWLQNDDQKALSAYQKGDFSSASSAQMDELKGAALYKQGNYEKAAELFKNSTSAKGQYNYGNALAQLGQLDVALEAYDKALNLDPDLAQAKANKQLLEQMKKQQQQQQQQQQQDTNQDPAQQNQQQSENQQGSDAQKGSQSEEQQGDKQQQGKEQSGDEQQGSQSEGENQDASDAEPSKSSKSDGQEGQNNQPDMQAEPNKNQQAGKDDEKSDAQEQMMNDAQQQAQDEKEPQQAGLADEKADGEDKDNKAQAPMVSGDPRPLTPEEREKAEKIKQLLRKVPDEPSILLRNKMLLEAQQRGRERYLKGVEKSW